MTSTAPRPIIRGTKTVEEKRQYDYSKGVLPYIPEEVDDFETEATRYLNGEWPTEEQFIMYRLVRGVYGQRQPDVQMMRIKIPGGALTPESSWRRSATSSASTPRSRRATSPPARTCRSTSLSSPTPRTSCASSATPGLITREACGNTVRNVAGDPLSGVKLEEPFYVAPYLAAYARYFVRHEYTQALPRKWKTSFSSGGRR